MGNAEKKKGNYNIVSKVLFNLLLYLNLNRTNIPVMFILINDFYGPFWWIDCVYMSFSGELMILFKYSYPADDGKYFPSFEYKG